MKFICLLVISCISMIVGNITNLMSQSEKNAWKNPALIYGSDFGRIFQRSFINGDIPMLMNLTASESRTSYGDTAIFKYYSQMQFAFPMKLVNVKKENNSWLLSYKIQIAATQSLIRLKIILEGDTCRLLLPSGFITQEYFLYK